MLTDRDHIDAKSTAPAASAVQVAPVALDDPES